MVYRQNIVLLFLSAFLLFSFPLFARGRTEDSRPHAEGEVPGSGGTDFYSPGGDLPPEDPAMDSIVGMAVINSPENALAQSRGEQVMKALAVAYPEAVEGAEYRNSDWAVKLRGSWYYYAGGRLLPEEFRSRFEEYDPQPFYNYQAELSPWREPSQEEAERFRSMTRSRRSSPRKRAQFFFDDLWRSHDRSESYERVKSLRFLGRPVLVHYSILEELSLVEERIQEEAKTNAEVRRWINSLETLTGWNWRTIADTQSRSFHAYGAAIDLLPRSLEGLETYWLWAAERSPEWWTVPYNRRFHPPLAVIRAFEAYGFIWGGKWTFFDTMHFEYRPELLLLGGLSIEAHR